MINIISIMMNEYFLKKQLQTILKLESRPKKEFLFDT